jgi:predicted amidohydrolase YtcJ
MISRSVDAGGKLESVQENIRAVAAHPLRAENPRLRIIGIKTYLDGGMLTGSAYLRQPWGVSEIYSIRDPEYRGAVHSARATGGDGACRDRARPQFTAHAVGDGAVHALLDAYAEVDRDLPLRATRPCISTQLQEPRGGRSGGAARVAVDIQPAWLFLDTRTLMKQFGAERLRYFQPPAACSRSGPWRAAARSHAEDRRARIKPYDLSPEWPPRSPAARA